MINVKKTITTREVKTLELTSDQVEDALKEYFKLPNGEVSFDIRQGGGFLAGCVITQSTQSTKEVPNGQG